MSGHVPFLKTIIDRPGDLGPRLIYSDWLEEQGDTDLAEYVRLGCEWHRQPPAAPGRGPIEKRLHELFRRHRGDWLGPFAAKSSTFAAFPDDDDPGVHSIRFTCSTAQLLKRLGADAGRARLPHSWSAELTDLGSGLAAFLCSPHLEWLTFLFPYQAQLAPEQFAALLDCRNLTNLRGLNLTGAGVGDAECRLLAAATHLGKLQTLVLGDVPLTESGLHAVLDSRRLAALRNLHVHDTRLAGRAPPPLKYSSRHPRLHTLRLRRSHLGDDFAAWLSNWPGLRVLARLDLSDGHIGPAGAAALASSPHLAGLEHLDLSGNPLGDAGVRALAEAEFLPRLKSLKVNRCGIGSAGGRLFLTVPVLPAKVAVFDNPLGDARAALNRRPSPFSY